MGSNPGYLLKYFLIYLEPLWVISFMVLSENKEKYIMKLLNLYHMIKPDLNSFQYPLINYLEFCEDLKEWLCVTIVQVCCLENHYGSECTPCSKIGENGKICSGNGKCKGSGTRKGNGACLCDSGTTGMAIRVVEFSSGDTKLKRFLHKNQRTQRKLLNFEFWINGELLNWYSADWDDF